MGHLVNPIAIRLGVNRIWNSSWSLYHIDSYKYLIHSDFFINKFLDTLFSFYKIKLHFLNVLYSHCFIIRRDNNLYIYMYIFYPQYLRLRDSLCNIIFKKSVKSFLNQLGRNDKIYHQMMKYQRVLIHYTRYKKYFLYYRLILKICLAYQFFYKQIKRNVISRRKVWKFIRFYIKNTNRKYWFSIIVRKNSRQNRYIFNKSYSFYKSLNFQKLYSIMFYKYILHKAHDLKKFFILNKSKFKKFYFKNYKFAFLRMLFNIFNKVNSSSSVKVKSIKKKKRIYLTKLPSADTFSETIFNNTIFSDYRKAIYRTYHYIRRFKKLYYFKKAKKYNIKPTKYSKTKISIQQKALKSSSKFINKKKLLITADRMSSKNTNSYLLYKSYSKKNIQFLYNKYFHSKRLGTWKKITGLIFRKNYWYDKFTRDSYLAEQKQYARYQRNIFKKYIYMKNDFERNSSRVKWKIKRSIRNEFKKRFRFKSTSIKNLFAILLVNFKKIKQLTISKVFTKLINLNRIYNLDIVNIYNKYLRIYFKNVNFIHFKNICSILYRIAMNIFKLRYDAFTNSFIRLFIKRKIVSNTKLIFNVNFMELFHFNTILVTKYISIRLKQKYKLLDILKKVYKFFRILLRLRIIIGYKVVCAGRFSRKERATFMWRRKGLFSLNKLSNIIDYSFNNVTLKFGTGSVKIWFCLNNISQNLKIKRLTLNTNINHNVFIIS